MQIANGDYIVADNDGADFIGKAYAVEDGEVGFLVGDEVYTAEVADAKVVGTINNTTVWRVADYES